MSAQQVPIRATNTFLGPVSPAHMVERACKIAQYLRTIREDYREEQMKIHKEQDPVMHALIKKLLEDK